MNAASMIALQRRVLDVLAMTRSLDASAPEPETLVAIRSQLVVLIADMRDELPQIATILQDGLDELNVMTRRVLQ
jgi:hypothetical protein